jgi:hypothetical protein
MIQRQKFQVQYIWTTNCLQLWLHIDYCAKVEESWDLLNPKKYVLLKLVERQHHELDNQSLEVDYLKSPGLLLLLRTVERSVKCVGHQKASLITPV